MTIANDLVNASPDVNNKQTKVWIFLGKRCFTLRAEFLPKYLLDFASNDLTPKLENWHLYEKLQTPMGCFCILGLAERFWHSNSNINTNSNSNNVNNNVNSQNSQIGFNQGGSGNTGDIQGGVSFGR